MRLGTFDPRHAQVFRGSVYLDQRGLMLLLERTRRVITRKSEPEPERLLDTVSDALHALSGSLTKGKVMKAGLIAVGLAGLTAGSAAISSLRRRTEGARGNR